MDIFSSYFIYTFFQNRNFKRWNRKQSASAATWYAILHNPATIRSECQRREIILLLCAKGCSNKMRLTENAEHSFQTANPYNFDGHFLYFHHCDHWLYSNKLRGGTIPNERKKSIQKKGHENRYCALDSNIWHSKWQPNSNFRFFSWILMNTIYRNSPFDKATRTVIKSFSTIRKTHFINENEVKRWGREKIWRKLVKKLIYLFSFVWKVFVKWVFPWMIANAYHHVNILFDFSFEFCTYFDSNLNCYLLLMKTKIQNFLHHGKIIHQTLSPLITECYPSIVSGGKIKPYHAHGKYSQTWTVNLYRLTCMEWKQYI